jgi:extracellular factor (EF) 3-hydroxypalmitic acid methyl ester biosynthesis protein
MVTTAFRLPERVSPRKNLVETLDSAVEALATRKPARLVVTDLVSALSQSRAVVARPDWRNEIIPQIRSHLIMQYALQDPFTFHSFQKPRGYPGDAELLDMIYSESRAHQLLSCSALGQQLFQCTSNFSAAVAVRWRKAFLAQEIDSIATNVPGCRILSIACGHLREAGLSKAVTDSRFHQFVALDQDVNTLSTVEHFWQKSGIRVLRGTVRDLLRKRLNLGRFDLVYAAGLYDYLQSCTAKSLTSCLFDLLDSGGVLLIANFLPNITESAYMEAFGDWWLIYRSLDEIENFAEPLTSMAIADVTLGTDPSGCIGYIRIVKT